MKVAIAGKGHAECKQVLCVQFQRRINRDRRDVVDFQFFHSSADLAEWMSKEPAPSELAKGS